MDERHLPYIILGAGCAGLSLCCYLLRAGVTKDIILLDQRTTFTDDRTWCFWNLRPNPFTPLATHCWHGWKVYGPTGDEIAHTGTATGYARLRAIDFYESVLAEIAQAPKVSLCLGEQVLGYEEDANGVNVLTGDGTIRAALVFDGRGPGAGGADELRQHFLGQTLRTSAPTFDPSKPTLMDFRVSQAEGVRFVYVLPLSPTEALVENTCLGGTAWTPEAHRAEIADYARRFLGVSDFAVVQEEAGAIPMSMRCPAQRRSQRVFRIGQAGGASKPSSGYTFQRIQDHCRALALAVQCGTPDEAPHRFAPRRFAFYDAAFLEALRRTPEQFPAYFCKLFRSVPPDALARFLTETSTWQDEARAVAALPPGPFLAAALASAPVWLPHLFS